MAFELVLQMNVDTSTQFLLITQLQPGLFVDDFVNVFVHYATISFAFYKIVSLQSVSFSIKFVLNATLLPRFHFVFTSKFGFEIVPRYVFQSLILLLDMFDDQ